jgi:hypothetical protein
MDVQAGPWTCTARLRQHRRHPPGVAIIGWAVKQESAMDETDFEAAYPERAE